MAEPIMRIDYGREDYSAELDPLDVDVLESIMHRASFNARTNHEREVIYLFLSACSAARNSAELKMERELECP